MASRHVCPRVVGFLRCCPIPRRVMREKIAGVAFCAVCCDWLGVM